MPEARLARCKYSEGKNPLPFLLLEVGCRKEREECAEVVVQPPIFISSPEQFPHSLYMLCVAFFHTQEISGSHIDIQDLT